MVAVSRISALISAHYGTRHLKILTCAPDVHEVLMGAWPEKAPAAPGDICGGLGAVSDLLAIQVNVNNDYAPGQWDLVRHDACEVTGGDDTDMQMTVTHDKCTVLDGEPRE